MERGREKTKEPGPTEEPRDLRVDEYSTMRSVLNEHIPYHFHSPLSSCGSPAATSSAVSLPAKFSIVRSNSSA